jgi:hypothetical protein
MFPSLATRPADGDKVRGWRDAGRLHRVGSMLFLLRVILVTGALAALGYGALYALGALVEPEPREIVIQIPMPKRN